MWSMFMFKKRSLKEWYVLKQKVKNLVNFLLGVSLFTQSVCIFCLPFFSFLNVYTVGPFDLDTLLHDTFKENVWTNWIFFFIFLHRFLLNGNLPVFHLIRRLDKNKYHRKVNLKKSKFMRYEKQNHQTEIFSWTRFALDGKAQTHIWLTQKFLFISKFLKLTNKNNNN